MFLKHLKHDYSTINEAESSPAKVGLIATDVTLSNKKSLNGQGKSIVTVLQKKSLHGSVFILRNFTRKKNILSYATLSSYLMPLIEN